MKKCCTTELKKENQPTFLAESWRFGSKNKLLLADGKIKEILDNSIGKKCWLYQTITVKQPTKGLSTVNLRGYFEEMLAESKQQLQTANETYFVTSA